MKKITVFTPAYNRAKTIHLCYESLLRQTCDNFIWLVIDDGSTDNTTELVKGWLEEKRIEIHYHYQKNQGMHGAHNTAYKLIETELCICVDSDDYLADNAIELILNKWYKEGSNNFAGIIGLDCDFNGKILGRGKFPESWKTTTVGNYVTKGYNSDHKFVYRTDLMKITPEYPLFEGENYCSLLSKKLFCDMMFELLILNEPLCFVEYQIDGITKNKNSQYFRFPKGFAYTRKIAMQLRPTCWSRYKEAIHYVSSSIILKNRQFLKESPRKLLTFCAIPLGCVVYVIINWRRFKTNWAKN